MLKEVMTMSETISRSGWLDSLASPDGSVESRPSEARASEDQNELLDALFQALEEGAHVKSPDRSQVAKALAMVDGSDGAANGSPILQWLKTFYEEASSGKFSVSGALERAKELFSLSAPKGLPTVANTWAENRNLTEIAGIDSLWDRIVEGVSSLCTNPIGVLDAKLDMAWDRVKGSFAKLIGGTNE
jgi:hypothetical protein